MKRTKLVNIIVTLIFSLSCLTANARMQEDLIQYFNNEKTNNFKIHIKTTDIADNPQNFPVTIKIDDTLDTQSYIKEISLYTCHNLNDTIAKFNFPTGLKTKEITTRIKLDSTGYIYAIAKTNNNQIIIDDKYVKVMSSGSCCYDDPDTNKAKPVKLDKTTARMVTSLNTETRTSKRSTLAANMTRMMTAYVGELSPNKMRASIKVAGYRARVLLDLQYYNPAEIIIDGTFKIRLPDGASPYYIAYGDVSNKLDDSEYLSKVLPTATNNIGFNQQELAPVQQKILSNLREAIMVPKVKARQVYQFTPRSNPEPGKVKWFGSGIYTARVISMLPDKWFHIIVGYDIDLPRDGKLLTFDFSLPQDIPDTKVVIHLAKDSIKPDRVIPKPSSVTNIHHTIYKFNNPESDMLQMQFIQKLPVVMNEHHPKKGHHFALRIKPDIPNYRRQSISNTVQFMIDTSYSTSPKHFNNYVNLVQSILENNESEITRFSVLFFNISTQWWQRRYTLNTAYNRALLKKKMQSIVLDGATDFHRALETITSPDWLNPSEKIATELFVLSDGNSTWGDTRIKSLKKILKKSSIKSLYSYASAGQRISVPLYKALNSIKVGSSFIIKNKNDIIIAAKAHHYLPWNIDGVSANNAHDILIAGTPQHFYSGQILEIVGRGELNKGLNLHLSRKNKKLSIPLGPYQSINTDLTSRIYGQVAVNQLDKLYSKEASTLATTYATEYQITGKNTTLLMLESQQHYNLFDITPPSDLSAINTAPASAFLKNYKHKKSLPDNNKFVNSIDYFLDRYKHSKCRYSLAMIHTMNTLPENIFSLKRHKLTSPITIDAASNSQSRLDFSNTVEPADRNILMTSAAHQRTKFGNRAGLIRFSTLLEGKFDTYENLPLLLSSALYALSSKQPQDAYYLFLRALDLGAHPYTTNETITQALIASGNIEFGVLFNEFNYGHSYDTELSHYLSYSQQKMIFKEKRYEHIKNYLTYNKRDMQKFLTSRDLVIKVKWVGRDFFNSIIVKVNEPYCTYFEVNECGRSTTGYSASSINSFVYQQSKANKGNYQIEVTRKKSPNAAYRTSFLITIFKNQGTENEKVINKFIELPASQKSLVLDEFIL